MRVLITGVSGFVGQNVWEYLSRYDLELGALSLRGAFDVSDIQDADVILHLAGKAHDVKNVSQPDEYYRVNFDLTKKLYDIFLQSNAKKFIFISSVKAVADHLDEPLTEDVQPAPLTHYGKSKLMAENYIRTQILPVGKSFYILRPCMIHGPGNKGNLNLLYKLVSKRIPWPLGAFENQRSFLSIENLCFVVKELIERNDIDSGIYQVSDTDTLSTNDLIRTIANELKRKPRIFNFSTGLIINLAKIGDKIRLPLNSEQLGKLTGNYVVSNKKIIAALKKNLPVQALEGMITTIRAFKKK